MKLFPSCRKSDRFDSFPKQVLVDEKKWSKMVVPLLRVDAAKLKDWCLPFDPVFFLHDIKVDALNFRVQSDGYHLLSPQKPPAIQELSEMEKVKGPLTDDDQRKLVGKEICEYDQHQRLIAAHDFRIVRYQYDQFHRVINKKVWHSLSETTLLSESQLEHSPFDDSNSGYLRVTTRALSVSFTKRFEVFPRLEGDVYVIEWPESFPCALSGIYNVIVDDKVLTHYPKSMFKAKSSPGFNDNVFTHRIYPYFATKDHEQVRLIEGGINKKSATVEHCFEQKEETTVNEYTWSNNKLSENGVFDFDYEFVDPPVHSPRVNYDRYTKDKLIQIPRGFSPAQAIYSTEFLDPKRVEWYRGMDARITAKDQNTRVEKLKFRGNEAVYEMSLEPTWIQSPQNPKDQTGQPMRFVAQLSGGELIGSYYLFTNDKDEVSQVFQCS